MELLGVAPSGVAGLLQQRPAASGDSLKFGTGYLAIRPSRQKTELGSVKVSTAHLSVSSSFTSDSCRVAATS